MEAGLILKGEGAPVTGWASACSPAAPGCGQLHCGPPAPSRHRSAPCPASPAAWAGPACGASVGAVPAPVVCCPGFSTLCGSCVPHQPGGAWSSPLTSCLAQVSRAAGRGAQGPKGPADLGPPPPAPLPPGKQAGRGALLEVMGQGGGLWTSDHVTALGSGLLGGLGAAVCPGSAFFLQRGGGGAVGVLVGVLLPATTSQGGWAASVGSRAPWPSRSGQGSGCHRMAVRHEAHPWDQQLEDRPLGPRVGPLWGQRWLSLSQPHRHASPADQGLGGFSHDWGWQQLVRGPWELCLGQRGVASAPKGAGGHWRGPRACVGGRGAALAPC